MQPVKKRRIKKIHFKSCKSRKMWRYLKILTKEKLMIWIIIFNWQHLTYYDRRRATRAANSAGQCFSESTINESRNSTRFCNPYTVPQAHWSTINTNQHETAVAGPESPGKFGICLMGQVTWVFQTKKLIQKSTVQPFPKQEIT